MEAKRCPASGLVNPRLETLNPMDVVVRVKVPPKVTSLPVETSINPTVRDPTSAGSAFVMSTSMSAPAAEGQNMHLLVLLL
eukprot:1122966-Amphidinium_carterae.1